MYNANHIKEFLSTVNITMGEFVYDPKKLNLFVSTSIITELSATHYDLLKLISILFPNFFTYVRGYCDTEKYSISISSPSDDVPYEDIYIEFDDIDTPGWRLHKFIIRALEATLKLSGFASVSSIAMSTETYSAFKIVRFDEIYTEKQDELFRFPVGSIHGKPSVIDDSLSLNVLKISTGGETPKEFIISLSDRRI